MNEPELSSQESIARAVELMAKAGWLVKSRVNSELAETWFTKNGLRRATQMVKAVLELDCRSDHDLRCVIAVLTVVLEKDLKE